jgi:chorismate mutase
MLVCRGIRGATTAKENAANAIYDATRELLTQLIEANQIEEENVAAVYFTATPDLNAAFPAAAARQLGWNSTALMDATEIAVPGSLTRCVRVLILFNTEKSQRDIVNIYLNGTDVLRLQGVQSG